jgi:hypothetical protein
VSLRTWTAISGIVFAVSFIAASLVLDVPGHDDSEEALNDFYNGSSGRLQVVVGSYLFVLSGLTFLAFVALLSRMTEGADASLRTFAISSAAVASALLVASAAAHSPSYVAYAELFDEPDSELRRGVIPHIALSLQIFAMIAAGVSVFAVCLAAREAGSLSDWIIWTGFAAAALAASLGMFYMPMYLVPLWALVASIALIADRRPIQRESVGAGS